MYEEYHKILLALSLLPGIGRKKLMNIVNAYPLVLRGERDSLEAALSECSLQLMREFFRGKGSIYQSVESMLIRLAKHNIGIVDFNSSDYPYLLSQIPDPPVCFFYRGDLALLNQPQIAIVGSRNASQAGLSHAYAMARDLSRLGLVITSGLALGIDGAAHSGALDNEQPSIAVMGTGLDRVYPVRHNALALRLLNNGCWVSEYFPGSAPIAANFPRRNRIISGLSLGVLVVEAREKSGTLITARMALEQNREVFAIPGSIDYEGSAGCHRLISEGAKLVQCVEDIMEELQLPYSTPLPSVSQREIILADSEHKNILELIEYSDTSFDQLCRMSGVGINELLSIVIELELIGLVTSSRNSVRRLP